MSHKNKLGVSVKKNKCLCWNRGGWNRLHRNKNHKICPNIIFNLLFGQFSNSIKSKLINLENTLFRFDFEVRSLKHLHHQDLIRCRHREQTSCKLWNCPSISTWSIVHKLVPMHIGITTILRRRNFLPFTEFLPCDLLLEFPFPVGSPLFWLGFLSLLELVILSSYLHL